MTARRGFTIATGATALILLAGLFLGPQAMLRAWLAAAFVWSGIPLGALLLLMIVRLIGGRWGHGLAPWLEAGAQSWSIAAAALVPVVIGMRWLYPWVSRTPLGFRGAWLAPWPFALRSILLFAVAGAFTSLLVARRGRAVRVAAVGLVLLVPLMSLVAVDWIISLDPAFHSSAFGLYAAAMQVSVALSVTSWLMLGRQLRRTATLGALMLTLVLINLYLAFTSYFIIWSGDLAPLVPWYRVRGSGGWGLAYAFVAAVEGVAFLALLFPQVRSSAKRLRAIAAALLLAKLVEAAWLVIPGSGPAVTLPLYAATAVALGAVFILAQGRLLDRRIAQRAPHAR